MMGIAEPATIPAENKPQARMRPRAVPRSIFIPFEDISLILYPIINLGTILSSET
jgi:hypothetical protein